MFKNCIILKVCDKFWWGSPNVWKKHTLDMLFAMQLSFAREASRLADMNDAERGSLIATNCFKHPVCSEQHRAAVMQCSLVGSMVRFQFSQTQPLTYSLHGKEMIWWRIKRQTDGSRSFAFSLDNIWMDLRLCSILQSSSHVQQVVVCVI